MHVALERISTIKNVLAQVSARVSFVHRLLEDVELFVELHPHVNVCDLRLRGVSGYDRSFEKLMRVRLHQHPVAEGRRFGLIRVDAQKRVGAILRQETPFHPGREPRTTASAQVGLLDLLDDLLRRHFQRLAQGLISAARFVHLERGRVLDVPIPQ